jgi:hypothetical protein
MLGLQRMQLQGKPGREAKGKTKPTHSPSSSYLYRRPGPRRQVAGGVLQHDSAIRTETDWEKISCMSDVIFPVVLLIRLFTMNPLVGLSTWAQFSCDMVIGRGVN